MTDTRNDGGSAFPHPGSTPNPGMTLRDYFAGQALAGLLAFPGELNGGMVKTGAALARDSYAMADFMLAERGRSK